MMPLVLRLSGVGAGVLLDAWMLRLSDCVVVCGVFEESVADTVKVELPVCVGAPEMAPAWDKLKPAGSEPELTFHE